MADAQKISQFQNPHGLGGRVAGWVMAWWNAGMNGFVFEMVDPHRRDHLLEVGFGPGTLLKRFSRAAELGFVAGVEPSEAMSVQAARRNRDAIKRGRMELKPGDIAHIPYPDSRFDAVCTVNTIYFWQDREASVREVRRVLREGGHLALAFRVEEPIPQSFSAGRGLGGFAPDRACELVESAGFEDVRVEIRRVRLMTAACVTATK